MKLVAIDLDGTLLNKKSEISRTNVAAIRAAQERGVEIVISTGRMYFDVQTICRRAGIITPVISANGGAVHDRKGNLLQHSALKRCDALAVLKWLEEKEVYYETSSASSIYVPAYAMARLAAEVKRLQETDSLPDGFSMAAVERQQSSQDGRVMVQEYHEAIPPDEELYKLYAISYDAAFRQRAILALNAMPGVAVYQGGPNSFEAVSAAASKGNGLRCLTKHLGISLCEAAAIGDSQNDISMLEAVGYSVAMGNAAVEVKSICRAVTRSNEENGVAHALKELLPGLAS